MIEICSFLGSRRKKVFKSPNKIFLHRCVAASRFISRRERDSIENVNILLGNAPMSRRTTEETEKRKGFITICVQLFHCCFHFHCFMISICGERDSQFRFMQSKRSRDAENTELFDFY